MTLRCDFDGVPTPSVVWLHNGTIDLEADPRVTINTNNMATTMSIANLGRDGGGDYSCRFNISDNVLTINATTVRILSELQA